MPMIVPLLINSACSSAYSNHIDACSKAMEAFSRQTGLYDGSERTENYVVNRVRNGSDNYLGSPITTGIASIGYAYKVIHSKSLSFRIPNMGICDTITNQITPTSYSIGLKWEIR